MTQGAKSIYTAPSVLKIKINLLSHKFAQYAEGIPSSDKVKYQDIAKELAYSSMALDKAAPIEHQDMELQNDTWALNFAWEMACAVEEAIDNKLPLQNVFPGAGGVACFILDIGEMRSNIKNMFSHPTA